MIGLLLASAPLLGALPAGGNLREPDELARRLHETRDDEGARAELRVEILDLGPRDLPLLVDLVSGRADLRDQPSPSAADREFVVKLIAQWPAQDVLDQVSARRRGAADASRTLVTWQVLSELETLDALDPLMQSFADLDPALRRDRRFSEVFEDALEATLRSDRGGLRALGERLEPGRGLVEDVLSPAGRAASRLDCGESARLLQGLLGQSSELDRVLLRELGGMSTPDDPDVASEIRDRLTLALTDAEPAVRAEAALALGRRRDTGAFPDLLSALSDSEGRVHRAALDALQAITGRALGSDLGLWRAWHEAESLWLFESSDELFLELETGSKPEALAALREIARHPFYLSEFAHAVADATQHPEESVAAAACELLGRHAEPTIYAPLIAALDDSRVRVRTSACAALRSASGDDAGEDAAAWARWSDPWQGLERR